MSTTSLPLLTRCLLGVIFVMASSMAACSGCGTPDPPDGVTITCPEVACGALERCVEGVCIGATDLICFPRCQDGEICSAGECVPGVEVCTQAGENCDPREPLSGDFYCIDWDGVGQGDPAVCVEECDAEAMCQDGAACFFLSGLDDSTCVSDETCSEGTTCRQGACRVAACQASECEGFYAGQQTCQQKYAGLPQFPSGANCQELPDGTNFCFPAGGAAIGERCEDFLDGAVSGDFTGTCGPGLWCVQGTCQAACEESSQCAGEAQECLFAEEDFVAGGVGFCGQPCAPFSIGECGVASKCLPVGPGQGYCVAAGEREAFERCEPDAYECVEGTYCIALSSNSESETQGRCMPMCDVTVAPPDPSQAVTEMDQVLRDLTCPQPDEVSLAFLRVMHTGEGVGAVDVYFDNAPSPTIAGLLEDELYEGVSAERGWLSLPPGAHLVGIWPAGTPTSEAPLIETSFAISQSESRELIIAAPRPDTADAIALGVMPSFKRVASEVRFVNAIADVDAVDVEVYLPGQVPGGPDPLLLVEGVGRFESTALTVEPGRYEVYVWRAGARGEGSDLVSAYVLSKDEPPLVLYARGSAEPDDGRDLEILRAPLGALPMVTQREPRMLCNDLSNGAFGFCQQKCRGSEDYGAGVCDGAEMGCYPVRLPGFQGWQSLCQPGGEAEIGERCNPFAAFEQCAQGSYCLEYGNADPSVAAGDPRGVCTSLCVVERPMDANLSCEAAQICQPIDPDSFDIGRCGYGCEPGNDYADASCPEGLGSCKPSSRLIQDTTGAGDSAPLVEEVDAVCSASGVSLLDEGCAGADCAPGTECLYPRSGGQDLVSTLLSPYFAGGGASPTCRAQCDPFDGVRSSTRCGPEETCLVNFPWSADVGHCAPIVERVTPLQGCSRPGESCGEDSICVVDGGAPFCLRLCEYSGGLSASVFNQSTCPAGLQCAPLVNDIGFCR